MSSDRWWPWALGPLQFSSRLRSRRLALHRWIGRLYLGAGVLIGGGAGFYMALHAFGGLAARLGFACLAVAWLYTGLRAYLAIRARNIPLHRAWMVRNFALTFAAVTLRIYVPASMAGAVAFEAAYPYIAWACWIPNLIAAGCSSTACGLSPLHPRCAGRHVVERQRHRDVGVMTHQRDHVGDADVTQGFDRAIV